MVPATWKLVLKKRRERGRWEAGYEDAKNKEVKHLKGFSWYQDQTCPARSPT